MQDIALLFSPEEKVGVTHVEKVLAETSAKNDLSNGI